MDAIYHAEGRAVPQGEGFLHNYVIRDHLGNTRVVFFSYIDPNNSTDLVVIAQTYEYYPFGLFFDAGMEGPPYYPYTYNHKEWNGDYGLDWYDYGARWYDAAVGRWWSGDPMAEEYKRWSPYNYGVNNPVRFVDPDGMSADDIIVGGAAASEFVSLLSQRSGLTLNRDDKTGQLSYSGSADSGGNQELANLVMGIIDNHDVTVSVDAVATSENVLFDQDSRLNQGSPDVVDMGDFSAIENFPDVQAGLLGHVLEERATSGSYSEAHSQAIDTETSIINSGSPGVEKRSTEIDPKAEGNSRKGPDGTLYVKMLDYGAKDGTTKNNIYLTYSPGNLNLNSPNGAVPAKRSATNHKIKN